MSISFFYQRLVFSRSPLFGADHESHYKETRLLSVAVYGKAVQAGREGKRGRDASYFSEKQSVVR